MNHAVASLPPEAAAGLGAAEPPIFFPPLRADVDLLPTAPLTNGSPAWILHDKIANRFLQIGWQEFEILSRWDLGDTDAIVAAVNRETTMVIAPEDVRATGNFLQAQQFLGAAGVDTSRRQVVPVGARPGRIFRFLLHHYLFFRIPLVHPDTFLKNTLWLVRPLLTPAFRALIGLLGVLGLFLVSRQWDVFVRTTLQLLTWHSALAYAGAVCVAKACHELGHAYTCKKYGLHVPVIGVAFLVLCPFLYTDTGEAWKLPARQQRLDIVIGGMGAELTLAVLATLAWSILPPGILRDTSFFLATTSWFMTLAINSNPFMRWDGYYFLSDLTGIKNLQPRAMALGKWRLREWLFGFDDPPPEENPPGRQWFMIVYAYMVWFYRLSVFLGIALLVYHFFIKALALLLASIEVAWFVWLPIYKELKVWWLKRKAMRWNRHSVLSLAGVAIGAALFFLPWQGYALLPAVLKADEFIEFHPPASARVTQVLAKEGAMVQVGTPLFDLASPELEYKLNQATTGIALAEALLQRAESDRRREEREVAIEQQTKALRQYWGVRREQEQLHIAAPFAGKMVRVAEGVEPGLWVAENSSLGLMVGVARSVDAYAAAEELDGLEPGAEGCFYADNGAGPPLAVRVSHIGQVNAKTLPHPLLASSNGGPIAVHVDREGALRPEQSIFLVQLQPTATTGSYDTMQRGFVRIKRAPRSFALTVWRNLHSVVIRESGF